MSIGDNIKKVRELRSLTQSDLAILIGVSDKTVSSWEINRTEPKMGMIEKICVSLKCKKSDIIGDEIVAVSPHSLREHANFTERDIVNENNNDEIIHSFISTNEFERIKKFRTLDAYGQDVVDLILNSEWKRCTSLSGNPKNVANITIKEPIFIRNDSSNYKIMKDHLKLLKKEFKNTSATHADILKFLWSIGYNKKICLADIVAIINGYKVPSSQLFDHIYSYLTSSYEITFKKYEYSLNAANERTDIEITDEMKQHDDAFFNEED